MQTCITCGGENANVPFSLNGVNYKRCLRCHEIDLTPLGVVAVAIIQLKIEDWRSEPLIGGWAYEMIEASGAEPEDLDVMIAARRQADDEAGGSQE
jgi:hypothetical protein